MELPGTRAQPVIGRQVVADSIAGTSTLLNFHSTPVRNQTNYFALIINSNKAILPTVCHNQATVCQAMVARDAKNHNLYLYKEGDVVRLLLLVCFCKLSRKVFVICHVK
jgi:hypothetical protein